MVRLKHRYIIAQVVPSSSVRILTKQTYSSREIQTILREKIQELYGDVGLGEFGQATYVRYLDAKYTNIFVVKTTRDAQSKVHFALSCIGELSGSPICLRSLSINSCQRTCMQSLRQVIGLHFDHADMMSESELKDGRETVEKNLTTLEL